MTTEQNDEYMRMVHHANKMEAQRDEARAEAAQWKELSEKQRKNLENFAAIARAIKSDAEKLELALLRYDQGRCRK